MRLRALLFVVLALGACAKEPVVVKQQSPSKRRVLEKAPDDSADRMSIVSLARGSVITHRTGEAFLESSAIRAIDGDPLSGWVSPSGDLPQSVTIALAARSRIEKIGFRTDDQLPVNNMRVDASNDGITFSTLKTVKASETTDAQWFDIAPTEATHLRYTMLDATTKGADARLGSVLARGAELEAAHPGDLEGCWSMNGLPARFHRNGAHISGAIRIGNQPMHIDGGFDGRVYRLNWIRGNDYGYLLATVSPDGRHMNAFDWHEEPIPLFYGATWFGDRSTCGAAPSFNPETAKAFLQRTGRLSLFGLRFRDDGSIDREQSAAALQWVMRFVANRPQMRFVAQEYRRANADENRRFAQAQLDALRAELERAGANMEGVPFIARGSDAPRQRPDHEPMRALYSTVDLEIRR